MDILDDFISTVDAMLDSRRKKHITVVTIQTDEEEYEDE